jgi:hypothetical protein
MEKTSWKISFRGRIMEQIVVEEVIGGVPM